MDPLNTLLKQSISIFSFLFILLGNKQASAKTPKMEDCVPKSCGNGLNISYPFWLRDHQPSYCGFPPFVLTCDNNVSKPVFQVLELHFYVLDIFYDNHSMIFTAKEFFKPCPFPDANYTIIFSSTIGISSLNKEIYFLRNCSNDIDIRQKYKKIDCVSGAGAPAYFGPEYGGSGTLNQVDIAKAGCDLYVVPVIDYPEDSSDGLAASLRGGWMSNWTELFCSDCMDSGGGCGYNDTSRDFMCICPDQVQSRICRGAAKKKIKKNVLIEIVIPLASVGSFMLCLFAFVYILRSRKSHKNNWQNAELFLKQHESLIPKRYKYSEVQRMTKSFSNKLGQGGFGSVYKGTLRDGRIVAVKLLSESKGNGGEFINEVASISKTSHVNIVTLLGSCLEKSKRALIYEFMPNGSLEKFVYSDRSKAETQLDCEKLYEIATGIARGLEYLHNGCNTRIVHFDIKPHNILLDHDYCPKISDFGLAKLCPSRESIISMATARGTIGYIAPEVFSRSFGVVSSKSDVYSYGMMLLEMVGGKKKIDAENELSSEVYFPQWIYDNIDRYCKVGIPGVTSETEEFMRKMIIIGLWCIQMMPGNRPSMSKVVEMLNGSVDDLQIPPRS